MAEMFNFAAVYTDMTKISSRCGRTHEKTNPDGILEARADTVCESVEAGHKTRRLESLFQHEKRLLANCRQPDSYDKTFQSKIEKGLLHIYSTYFRSVKGYTGEEPCTRPVCMVLWDVSCLTSGQPHTRFPYVDLYFRYFLLSYRD